MKKKGLLSLEKDIAEWEKLLETIILKNNDLESSFDEENKDVRKINFEAVTSLQRDNLNKNLL